MYVHIMSYSYSLLWYWRVLQVRMCCLFKNAVLALSNIGLLITRATEDVLFITCILHWKPAAHTHIERTFVSTLFASYSHRDTLSHNLKLLYIHSQKFFLDSKLYPVLNQIVYQTFVDLVETFGSDMWE